MEAANVAANWCKNDAAPQGADWHSINDPILCRRLDAAACGDKVFLQTGFLRFSGTNFEVTDIYETNNCKHILLKATGYYSYLVRHTCDYVVCARVVPDPASTCAYLQVTNFIGEPVYTKFFETDDDVTIDSLEFHMKHQLVQDGIISGGVNIFFITEDGGIYKKTHKIWNMHREKINYMPIKRLRMKTNPLAKMKKSSVFFKRRA